MSSVKLLTQDESKKLDEELFSLGFVNDQLMELAGLSCASAIYHLYPPETHKRVLVVCGPGNNGGDGLVCARHLQEFGYTTIHITYPKRVNKSPFIGLSSTCVASGLQLHNELPSKIDGDFDLIVDAIFGYSFSGELRAPFDSVIRTLKAVKVPIIALDIPSGWDVEKGNVSSQGLEVETLISLGVPKLCAKHFTGKHHVLGGRFIPATIAAKHNLHLPKYPSSQQFVLLPKL